MTEALNHANDNTKIEQTEAAPQGNESGEPRLEIIKTEEEFEAVKGQLAEKMGYDPRITQIKPDTTGRAHKMDQLFTESSRVENHQEIHVWRGKGTEILGYAVVETPPTSGEPATITDIRVTKNTGVDGILKDFLMALKADLRDQSKRDIIYKEAIIQMPEGSAPIMDWQRTFEPTLINEFFKPQILQDPNKKAEAPRVQTTITNAPGTPTAANDDGEQRLEAA